MACNYVSPNWEGHGHGAVTESMYIIDVAYSKVPIGDDVDVAPVNVNGARHILYKMQHLSSILNDVIHWVQDRTILARLW